MNIFKENAIQFVEYMKNSPIHCKILIAVSLLLGLCGFIVLSIKIHKSPLQIAKKKEPIKGLSIFILMTFFLTLCSLVLYEYPIIQSILSIIIPIFLIRHFYILCDKYGILILNKRKTDEKTKKKELADIFLLISLLMSVLIIFLIGNFEKEAAITEVFKDNSWTWLCVCLGAMLGTDGTNIKNLKETIQNIIFKEFVPVIFIILVFVALFVLGYFFPDEINAILLGVVSSALFFIIYSLLDGSFIGEHCRLLYAFILYKKKKTSKYTHYKYMKYRISDIQKKKKTISIEIKIDDFEEYENEDIKEIEKLIVNSMKHINIEGSKFYTAKKNLKSVYKENFKKLEELRKKVNET